MPPKIRKKSETSGLDQPDQVMTTLQTTYGFLDKFKYYIVGGFFSVIIALLAVSWYIEHQKSQHKELAQGFFKAFETLDAPVGADLKATKDKPVFATEDEKFSKAIEELNAFIAENESADIADTARLVLASTKMETGDYEAAYTLFQEFVTKIPDSALIPLVYENLGYTCIRLGKADEAVQYFEKMKDATTSIYVSARALMHLGDLYNPAATTSALDPDQEKSRQYYQEALETLPEELTEEENPDPAITMTRQELKLRLSLLKLG
jgi:tetratricopeptide (TPR) repeat protein